MNLGYFFDSTDPDGVDRVLAQLETIGVNSQLAGGIDIDPFPKANDASPNNRTRNRIWPAGIGRLFLLR
jgi:hypothetical protein